MKVLIICTGNSCRSQMAQAFLQSWAEDSVIRSAGTEPADEVHPLAIEVMKEAGLDISDHNPVNVDQYIREEWDYVITVCGGAAESCPSFAGIVKHRMHIGFDDPAEAHGSDDFRLKEFRRVRDEIRKVFFQFFLDKIKSE